MGIQRTPYEGLVVCVASTVLGSDTGMESVDALVETLSRSIGESDPVIEADRSPDHDHLWSPAAVQRFNIRHLIKLVVDLAKGLKEKDIYTADSVRFVYEMTKPEGAGFSFVNSDDYNANRERVRIAALGYLVRTAPTPDTARAVNENKE